MYIHLLHPITDGNETCPLNAPEKQGYVPKRGQEKPIKETVVKVRNRSTHKHILNRPQPIKRAEKIFLILPLIKNEQIIKEYLTLLLVKNRTV